MGWWTARAGWSRRIGLWRAQRLLAGRRRARDPGLAALLSDAAGPARPEELTGEPDAIAAFRRLRSSAPSTVDDVGSTVDARRRRSSLWRSPTLRLAAAVLLLAAAGTVVVRFGYLPARVRPVPPVPSTAPVAGSPSPSTPAPSGPSYQPSPTTSTPPADPQPLAEPSATPKAPGAPKLTAQTSATAGRVQEIAEATRLCRVWTDPNAGRAARDLAAQRLRELGDVLDGPNGVPAFCRKILSPSKDKNG